MDIDQIEFLSTALGEDFEVDIDLAVETNNSTNEPVFPTVLAEARKISQYFTDYRSYAHDSATPMHQILSEVSNLQTET